ncbi:porphobilinogen synthase [Labilibacter sediminis]|nr:porphobilinogen synthase [Labilibacter sediminis]
MFKRFRQFRLSPEIRDNHADVALHARDLIYPYYVVDGDARKEPVPSLKDVYRFSIDLLLQDLEETVSLGIDKILLFGVVEDKDKTKDAVSAFKHNNLVENTVKKIKEKYPDLTVITDVCTCGYTNHGHCGVLNGLTVDNDKTIEVLARIAESHARGGADIVAPSAMMDGQVQAIRRKLNTRGYKNTKILSYSAKYASVYYGSEKDATVPTPSFGDRKTYQIDYRTKLQGLEEIGADLDEGADWVMVKPAHTYLDVLARARDKYPKAHIAAYQVSGEYMMLVNAAEHGYLDLKPAMIEALMAIKRAGANTIITFYAKKMALHLNGDPFYVI